MPADTATISKLINKALQPKGIAAKVVQKTDTLQIFLQSSKPINKDTVTAFLTNGIKKLNPDGLSKLIVYAKVAGQSNLSWTSQAEIAASNSPPAVQQKLLTPQPKAKDLEKSKLSLWLIAGTGLSVALSLPTIILFLLPTAISSGVVHNSFKKGQKDKVKLAHLWCKSFLYSFWGLFTLVGAVTALLPKSPRPESAVVIASPQTTEAFKGKAILAWIGQETKYEPTIDTWGNGKGLFLVKSGWDVLSDDDKNKVIEYAKANGVSAIVVGRFVERPPKNSIMLDETVWEGKVQPNPTQTISSNTNCTSAAGNIWTGVRVYRDSNCGKPFATILGGTRTNNEKGIVLKFDSGETEVKYRRVVAEQAYVRKDDPAMERKAWQEF